MTTPPGPLPRLRAVVDLEAVRHNVRTLAAMAPGAAFMAVVKADGYGHGMVPCARAAVEAGATWLGVATADEALELRRAGLTVPILCWLIAPDEDVAALVAAAVDVSVATVELLDRVASSGGRPRVHLKIDTGLTRGGALPGEDWAALCGAAARLAVEVVGIWSHLVHSEPVDHPTTDDQLARLLAAVEVARSHGLDPPLRHLANTAAVLTRPDLHLDLVRAGIGVYGLSPVSATSAELGLRPAMRLAATVTLVKRVPAGTSLSYGARWTTERETTVALVPMGYADGLPRTATNIGPLLVNGTRAVVSGTVCMDQVVADVGDAPVALGDEVVVFGPGDDGEPTVQEWAATTGTIAYEVVTRIGARATRLYL